MLRNSLLIFTLFVIITASGCAAFGTFNPATGKNEFIAISTRQEIQMGQSLHNALRKKYKFSTNASQINRMEKIGFKLSLVSDRQDYEYRFYLVEDPALNAFTTPGGNIYVHTGLLDKLESDDQVAFVIAHEIGHCAAKHVVKKYQAALGYDLIGNIILDQLSGNTQAQRIASLSSDVLTKLVFSAYSRKDENQADQIGIKYTFLAGYDPSQAADSFLILKKHAKEGYTPQMLRSHPGLDERIENVKRESMLVKEKYGRFRK